MSSLKIRVRLRDNALLLLLPAVLLCCVVVSIIRDGGIDIVFGIMGALPFCLLLIWLMSQRVCIDGDMFCYRSTMIKRETSISHIQKMRFQWGKPGLRANGLYLLCIYDDDRYSHDPICINIKPFNAMAVAQIINTLRKMNPHIDIDKRVEQMAEGNEVQLFPMLLRMLRGKKR